MDIEGAEGFALVGMRDGLARGVYKHVLSNFIPTCCPTTATMGRTSPAPSSTRAIAAGRSATPPAMSAAPPTPRTFGPRTSWPRSTPGSPWVLGPTNSGPRPASRPSLGPGRRERRAGPNGCLTLRPARPSAPTCSPRCRPAADRSGGPRRRGTRPFGLASRGAGEPGLRRPWDRRSVGD
jgi:hypothetical protein